ncbi:hypothetical protein LLEC1_02485 [Akanthomyces lecanii]|uniref:Uncharacterized protein n=1 Tax=Cordyceps confragosa TaxID=2714763 RepID=A0A179I9U0_CORDF|nr:hypothetical protein LLEC1_02485 [Akanthomyces lecanii]
MAGLAASAMASQQTDGEVDPVKICGRLGVMRIVPEDVPEGDVRMCAGHPMGYENYYGWGDYLPHCFPGPPTFGYG